MAEVFLISENKVRIITNMSSNMQSKFLLSAIREAHLDLELIIGTRLLNKLKDLISDGSIEESKNEKYKELVDECQFYLAYKTLTNIIMISSIHIDNLGVMQQTDEHTQALSINDLFKMKDFYTMKCDEFCKRIQMYLYAHCNEYPELTQHKIDEFHSNLYSAASTSIFLGGSRGRGYKNNSLRQKYDR